MLESPALRPWDIDDSIDDRMADVHALWTELPGKGLCQGPESKLARRKSRTVGGSSDAGGGALWHVSFLSRKSHAVHAVSGARNVPVKIRVGGYSRFVDFKSKGRVDLEKLNAPFLFVPVRTMSVT